MFLFSFTHIIKYTKIKLNTVYQYYDSFQRCSQIIFILGYSNTKLLLQEWWLLSLIVAKHANFFKNKTKMFEEYNIG